ncbi:MAG: hypothetical protein J7K36_04365, partial [Archaeoglobaceae archaeon]|nr:hypothetical protein [Archaeoglobaceae archaeon]
IIKDNWKKIVVLLLLTIVFSVLYFVFPTIFYGVLSFLRDAIEHFKLDYTLSVGSIASVLSALATLFLVWISIRNLNLSLSMMWGDIAQEALRNFILSQEKLIHRIKEKINDDNLIDYNDISKLIKKLEPDPSIVYVIYDEHPKLRIELAKFIKTVLDYNVNIDPEYSENVKKRTENVLESLQKLESKLYRKYAIYMPKYTYTS